MWHKLGHLVVSVLREVFFDLPGVVAFILAALALAVLYMDEAQELLRGHKARRWFVAITLVLMGLTAFVSDKVQRAQDKQELIDERKAASQDRQLLLQQNGKLITFGQAQSTHDDVN